MNSGIKRVFRAAAGSILLWSMACATAFADRCYVDRNETELICVGTQSCTLFVAVTDLPDDVSSVHLTGSFSAQLEVDVTSFRGSGGSSTQSISLRGRPFDLWIETTQVEDGNMYAKAQLPIMNSDEALGLNLGALAGLASGVGMTPTGIEDAEIDTIRCEYE